MPDNGRQAGFNRRYLVLIALFALSLYVILPQFGDFRASWQLLREPRPGWVFLAIVLTSATYLSAAATYKLLAFMPIKYSETVLVELAAMFVNRLLPGGIGALGGNYLYLNRKGHTPAQAGVVVALNNALGFLGHNVLFLSVLLIAGKSSIAMEPGRGGAAWLAYAIVVFVGVLLAAAVLGRQRLLRALNDFRMQLFEYRRRPNRLLWALGSSITLTLANVLALYAAAQALGIHTGFAPIFIIFSLGLSAGTVTPTPGGLGGFEAGLVAGFIAYGADSSSALAAALLYRLISYWLPLAVGAAALVASQKRRLL